MNQKTKWLTGIFALIALPAAAFASGKSSEGFGFDSAPVSKNAPYGSADTTDRAFGGGPVAGVETRTAPAANPVPAQADDGSERRQMQSLFSAALQQANENMMSADKDRYYQVVEFLLRHGADPDAAVGQDTPLTMAIDNDNFDLAQILVANHAKADKADGQGRLPLQTAASRGDEKIVRLLGDKCADVNVTDVDGVFPLSYAARWGQLDLVSYLVDQKGATVNVTDPDDGISPLGWAAMSGHTDVMTYLIDNGANVDLAKNNKGASTPLAGAAMNCHVDAVRLLMKAGADPSLRVAGETDTSSDVIYDEGKTAADYAAERCQSPVKEEILKILGGANGH